MKKRLLAFLLVLCCICSQAGIVALAEEIGDEAEEVTTGTCGDNGGFTWNLDTDMSTLTITGEDTWTKGHKERVFDYVGATARTIIFEDCVFSGSLKYMIGDFELNFDLSSVKFINCDTSQVTDMSGMFYHCKSLKE